MARRSTTRSLRRRRVTSIQRLKPQLPHTGGPFTAVRFFRLRSEGVEIEVEIVGTLRLQDGRLVADPADSPALHHVLHQEVRVHHDDGSVTILDSKIHPEAFLRALPPQYHGSYFWCEAVNNDTATNEPKGETHGTTR